MLKIFKKQKVDSIDIRDLENLLGKINLIDIRESYEYNNGHLPTAINIPVNKLLSESEEYLDKSKMYHIICQSGVRSSRACSFLKEKGFNIVDVTGGTGKFKGNLEK